MKMNNKGVTLIESIVTIAMIAILLGAMGAAFANIIHYMSESAFIKNTSNEIFESIQNNEGDSIESTMTFNDSLSVAGQSKTVVQNYNNRDQLHLTKFTADTVIPEYTADAHFYLLRNPYDRGKEGDKEFDNLNTLNVNELGKLNPNKNCVLNGTISSTDKDYITSHVKMPKKADTIVSFNIEMIIQNTEYYNGVSLSDVSIEWYRIIKKEGEPYSVYGIVKPYHKEVTQMNVEFIFINKTNSDIAPFVIQVNSKTGFSDHMIKEVFRNLQVGNQGKQWSSTVLFDGEKFRLEELINNLSIFDNLHDGETIYVYYK